MRAHFDRAYYEARLRQHQTLAAQARNEGARAYHLRHARLYEEVLGIEALLHEAPPPARPDHGHGRP